MSTEEPTTLKQVQLRLGVPAHVLIHLCEKGVVVPEFGDTTGRGKRRGFSERNVFELAVALALRDLELPVATAALLVRLLRSFERSVAKVFDGFALLDFLGRDGAQLSLSAHDGGRLVWNAAGGGLRRPLILAASLRDAGARMRLEKLAELPRDFEVRVEIDLVRIARRLRA